MTAIILSQITGLLRSILVLRAFGASPEMDAFTAANQVTDTLFALVAGGALASSFIPTFTGLLTLEDRRGAWKLASSIANLVFIIMTLIGAAAALLAPLIVRYLLAPGFADDPVQQELTVNLLRLMMPSVVIFGLSGLVMGILNSHRVFLTPALAPSMYSLGIIFGVIALTPTLGIYGLGWGVLIGASLHLGLQIPSLLRRKGEYYPILGLNLASVREVGRLIVPRLFGVAVVHLNFWVNIWLASHHPEGSVTALRAAFTLMLMPQAAIAQAIATAAMPTLAAQYARGRLDEVRTSLAASLRGVLLLSIPATVGLIILRRPIIVLLYERGAFDERSTDLVSWALLWFAAGLVGHCVVEILARAFYALHDTKTPVKVGAFAMGLNVIFSITLSTLFWRAGLPPHGGLALANSLATGLEMIGLIYLMRRRLVGIEGKSVVLTTLRAAGASVAMAIGLLFWLSGMQNLALWQLIGGGIVIGGLIYGTGLLITRTEEAVTLWKSVFRRLKR
jgi:putative peptidoglycan lipid II flippase